MPATEFIERSDSPRVLVVSHRLRKPVASRCMTYEFEDLICEMDDADIVAPTRSLEIPGWRRRMTRALSGLAAGPSRPMVERRYELLFVTCQSLGDLLHLGPIGRWLATADRAVCYIEELWKNAIAKRPREVELLRGFDGVIVGCRGSAEPLAAAIDRPCLYLPPGIDAVAFCPFPNPPERVIDVYGMGRRAPETHQAMLAHADRTNRFYLYDTMASYEVKEPRGHRRLLADLIKRSKFFVANRAKAGTSAQTGAQEEAGFRFFEGAAGGAVMIGDAPNCESFHECFGWTDSVVPLPFGSTAIGELIESLDADPDRMERIRRLNIENSLLRHDWLYRWGEIAAFAGLDLRSKTEQRRERLHQLASEVNASPRIAA